MKKINSRLTNGSPANGGFAKARLTNAPPANSRSASALPRVLASVLILNLLTAYSPSEFAYPASNFKKSDKMLLHFGLIRNCISRLDITALGTLCK